MSNATLTCPLQRQICLQKYQIQFLTTNLPLRNYKNFRTGNFLVPRLDDALIYKTVTSYYKASSLV
jgi:hypothetical protein